MKKIVIITLIALCLTTVSKAQDYNTGIGLRVGYTNGLTVKHFIGSTSALEGILGTRWGGFEITGLYELSYQAFHTDRLNWYIGFGGHVGFWDGNNTYWGDDNKNYTVIGIDGILGLEYNFREVPINLSIDWKPAMNIVGYTGFWGDGGALSIRYIF
ncbi:MAG: hypothetical protein PF517_12955 [Salinivirgaceae bacterium]|jgi:hypothetical protein|nr:hypothetical protein [Salinivirgaceae bacterium]